MKQALGLLAAGTAVLAIQGVAGAVVPPPYFPDLRFLLIVGIGLCAPVATGLVIAAVIGYATDLLSGALLGQHALLALLVFAATRLADRSVNLRGDLARAIFAALLTLAHAAGLSALAWLFDSASAVVPALALPLLVHALLNGAAAPIVAAGVDRLSASLSDEDTVRRPLRLEPRRRVS